MASSIPPRRILIVEDHADTADTMAAFLRYRGHQVDVARSGYAGLVAAIATEPEVILLDLEMPGMDGWEVARRLRATGEFDDVLIIAITGYGWESDRRSSAAAGIDHHLVKPILVEELERLLRAGREAS
jgi:two-component system, chemotaxis family, CheB/CheR fusion protein